MTASEVNEPGFTEKFIFRALIISLLIHLLAFSTYRIGQSQGWWANLTMPRWMQAISRVLTPALPKQIAAVTPASTPLMFVQVDPANAIPEAPKEAKYYGANNTAAANPEITKPSTVPDIRGKQTDYLKTVEEGKPKAQPLQPTPPPRPQVVAKAAAEKQSYTPGDMASAKPAETARDNETKTEAQAAVEAQPQPAYQRPRTLAEAMARSGTPGEMSQQAGGVNNIHITSDLDVKYSDVGAYDAEFVAAVQARWDQLWDHRNPNGAGKVVLSFRLLPDGSIQNLKMVKNEVTDLMETMCEQAIKDPAPYQPWPREMRLEIPADYRDIQFTFFYELN